MNTTVIGKSPNWKNTPYWIFNEIMKLQGVKIITCYVPDMKANILLEASKYTILKLDNLFNLIFKD